MEEKKPRTEWHDWYGLMHLEILTPVDLDVSVDFHVMSQSPRADLLIIRRKSKEWTAPQRSRLPDGIVDSSASHILEEFKATESLNEDAFQKVLGYDYYYRDNHNLKRDQVRIFIVTAIHPQKRRLEEWGFKEDSTKTGVYRSGKPLFRWITIISVSKLSDEPHNAYVKCFAGRKRAQQQALTTLKRMGMVEKFSTHLLHFISGLWTQWFVRGVEKMDYAPTPEQILQFGDMWGDIYLSHLTPEERLMGLKPEERLIGLKPEERLAGLSVLEIRAMRAYLERLEQEGGN